MNSSKKISSLAELESRRKYLEAYTTLKKVELRHRVKAPKLALAQVVGKLLLKKWMA